MELSRALRTVRAMLAKAESLEELGDAHSLHEAQLCREKADKVMQEHGEQEWLAAQAADKAFKPDRIKIDLGAARSLFLSEVATLCNVVAQFCNCRSVWMEGSGYYWDEQHQREEYAWVYGYESDLRYFELLFTTLYLHMSGAIFPKPDQTKTLEENAYDMRNAGLNWIEIATAYGWREVPREEGEPKNVYVNASDPTKRVGWSTAVGRIAAAYQREIKKRGEEAIQIPKNSTAALTYRMNAARGYLTRIKQRLTEIKLRRGTGTEIMLRDKSQNINALIDENHPTMRHNDARNIKFNAAAYERGTQRANEAELNPSAGRGSTPAVGA